ncbi:hypothetical protein N7494_012934 [Penicillium frequentans]|uniref:Uncharacterized protein n=1 Tax=Penicillium frequentans TaxID=3151616 RepID=A0AAD6CMK7_9EURO|nr:hypothetical protein N7494_012934 [Penicillium glabrum]
MPWTQKEDYWEAPLDVHEQFFNHIKDLTIPTGRENWMIMLNAELSYPPELDITTQLRKAWKAIRFRHPGIATELDPSGQNKRYYPIHDEGALESWAATTFNVVEDAPSAYEFLHSAIVRIAPPQATCYWIPKSNELALLSSHWRWDAHGSLWLMHDLLSELESPSLVSTFTGQEARNLAPSLDEVVGMPEKEDWDPNWEVQAAALHADAVTSDGTPAFTMREYPQMLPGNTARSEIVFSVEETSAVLAAIRARGLTVTPVINASVIEEAVCRNPNSDASRFISYGIFDLRKYCPPPSNGSTEAVSHRVLGLPLNVSTRASWIELVGTLKEYYGRSWTGESDALFVRRAFVEQILKKMEDPGAQHPVVSEPYFNNLGIVEGYLGHRYGDVKVKNVGFNDTIITAALVIHCFTWRGKLHLSLGYNEVFHEAGFVEEYLLAVKNNVLANLGLTNSEH